MGPLHSKSDGKGKRPKEWEVANMAKNRAECNGGGARHRQSFREVFKIEHPGEKKDYGKCLGGWHIIGSLSPFVAVGRWLGGGGKGEKG